MSVRISVGERSVSRDRFPAITLTVGGRIYRLPLAEATRLGWQLIKRSESIAGTPFDMPSKPRPEVHFEGELLDAADGSEPRPLVDDGRTETGA